MLEKVLVVDDEAMMLNLLVDALSMEGFDVAKADGLSKCFSEIQKSPPSIIVSDYQLNGGTAFDLLYWLKARDISIPLILITGHASIDLAVQAVKNGAEQFIPKPVDLGLLTTMIRRTLENRRIQKKDEVNKRGREREECDPFIGVSPAIQELKKSALRVAEANSTVLIQGETGSGKGVLARWLYRMGARSSEAFVDLNCAGLSRELLESELFGYQKGAFTGAISNKMGFLEAASGGTLFLDEIGDMDSSVQSKILKVVEEKRFYRLGDVIERKVDVHIIAATHRDLKKLAEDEKFRSDLYFRISTLRLRMPPLRERPEDIPIITDKLLDQLRFGSRAGELLISDEARSALQSYSWPGNIRELRNVLERAAILSEDGVIRNTSLEFEASAHRGAAVAIRSAGTLKEIERQHIQRMLELESGSVSRAAKRLGMPRSSLYAKLRDHNI
jgi:Response regulator containing CheY-like receiver, AAA-type ATPase, and DNA-binding domains